MANVQSYGLVPASIGQSSHSYKSLSFDTTPMKIGRSHRHPMDLRRILFSVMSRYLSITTLHFAFASCETYDFCRHLKKSSMSQRACRIVASRRRGTDGNWYKWKSYRDERWGSDRGFFHCKGKGDPMIWNICSFLRFCIIPTSSVSFKCCLSPDFLEVDQCHVKYCTEHSLATGRSPSHLNRKTLDAGFYS